MTLSDAQRKKIIDIGIGKSVTSRLNHDAQIAAIRKQVAAVSEAVKVPLDHDFKALEDIVAAEKKKKEEKAVPEKSKQTVGKSD